MSFLQPNDGAERWNKPPVGSIKLNTDAAIFLSRNRFSFALVARNHEGNLLEAKACCCGGLVSPEVVEAIGIKEALSWIKTKSWVNVVLESDALVVIQAIRSQTPLASYFGRIIQDCRSLLSSLSNHFISLQFVKRSANTVAHHIAKSTCIISNHSFSGNDIPADVNSVLLQDLLV